MVLFLLLLPLSAFIVQTSGLTCYETDNNGNVNAVTNPSYEYCVFLPQWSHNRGPISLFGIGAQNDDVQQYHPLFNTNLKYYKILTICLLEKITFSAVTPSYGAGISDEFMFRCLCNYDRCNSQKTFDKYLVNLEKDSFHHDIK